ncbi:MAG: ATP-binding protein [Candidatus Nanopelagicales bacterium]
MQHWTLPADHSAERLARDAITEALPRDGLDPRMVDDVVLATSELVSNAVDHGQAPIHLELETEAGRVHVTVSDAGTGQPAPRVAVDGAARGRGLSIVAQLATDWGWQRKDGRLHVWAEFRTGRPAGDA